MCRSKQVTVLVVGAGSSVWNLKIGPALGRLQESVKVAGIKLEVWGIEQAGNIGSSPLVKRWFCIDRPEDVTDLQTSLAAGEINLAVIASPNETHVGYLSLFLGHVPQIIVEKPLCEEVLEADLAVALSEGILGSRCRGLDHYVAKPAIRYLKSMARSGALTDRIGQIKHVDFSMLEARCLDPLRANTLARGLTFDMAIHGFAILLALLDLDRTDGIEIADARAARYISSPIPGETSARIEVRLRGDASATLSIGKGLYDKKTITIRGSLGAIEADISSGAVDLLVETQRDVLQSACPDDAYDAVLEEAVLETSGARAARPGNLVSLSLARDALRLVSEVRKRYDTFEPHVAGTVPSALGLRWSYNGVDVEIHPDRAALDRSVLREVLAAADNAIKKHGDFVLVIPGGSSFLGVSRLLLEDEFSGVDLSKWQVFFTDEHSSTHTGTTNNYFIAHEQGGWKHLVAAGRFPLSNLHRINTEESSHVLDAHDLAREAERYQALFVSALGERGGTDLAILGLGADCHTSSLLPIPDARSSAFLISDKVYDVMEYPASVTCEDHLRASLTARGIRSASKLIVLAFGSKKSSAIRDALTGTIDLARLPGTILRQAGGMLMTDEAGASRLAHR